LQVVALRDMFIHPRDDAENPTHVFHVTDYAGWPLHSLLEVPDFVHRLRTEAERTAHILFQLLCGLNYLHRMNIIHRDLHSANVALTSKNELRILDCGMSRCASNIQLTPLRYPRWWRAPEVNFQYDAHGRVLDYGRESDLWSVGCIFLELLGQASLLAPQDTPRVHTAEEEAAARQRVWKQSFSSLGTPGDECIALLSEEDQRRVRALERFPPINWEHRFPNTAFAKCRNARWNASLSGESRS
jgi:serine/threonine protein kinase